MVVLLVVVKYNRFSVTKISKKEEKVTVFEDLTTS